MIHREGPSIAVDRAKAFFLLVRHALTTASDRHNSMQDTALPSLTLAAWQET